MSASKEFNKARALFMKWASAPEIPASALKLAYLIAFKYMDAGTEATRPVDQDEMAEDLKLKVRQVRNLLRVLQPFGLEIEPGTGNGRGNASVYRIAERRQSTASFEDQKAATGDTKGGNETTLKAAMERPERRQSETPPSNIRLSKKESPSKTPPLAPPPGGATVDDLVRDLFEHGTEAEIRFVCQCVIGTEEMLRQRDGTIEQNSEQHQQPVSAAAIADGAPRPKRTPEQQARVDQHVKSVRAALGMR